MPDAGFPAQHTPTGRWRLAPRHHGQGSVAVGLTGWCIGRRGKLVATPALLQMVGVGGSKIGRRLRPELGSNSPRQTTEDHRAPMLLRVGDSVP